MAEIDENLRQAVEAWIEDDPDSETREELTGLLARGEVEEIRDRFRGSLQFGTAGLRGLLGAGPNRMNRAVVLRTTAGLCAWIKQQVPDYRSRGVCIGYDGRRLSRELAAEAAAVVGAAGIKARVFDDVVPTPLLAYAVLDRRAAAGIMITASHNPPAYNGYKVYWENGAQIIPPHDQGIAGSIRGVHSVTAIPRIDRAEAAARGLLEVLGEDIVSRYLDGVAGLGVHPETPRDVRIAYTALHGVGEKLARRALSEGGFDDVHSVASQAEPDGAFPTVSFPNPEEKGAMDRVLALAAEVDADLVIANDPDADRLAISVRESAGRYVSLNGNEIGCLLAHYLLDQREGEGRLVICSVVSSPMLGSIAEAHGARFTQALTGFKWIANDAMRLEREQGLHFVFGYEEALGYTVGTLVRDKDGISGAAVMADMAAWCKSRGRTLLDERDEMWRRYGLYLSRQISVVLPGAEGADRIDAIMEGVREKPPTRLGPLEVVATSDLLSGTRKPRDGAPTELDFPPSNVMILDLEGANRVMLRPSGTEPKIKFYFDVVSALEGQPYPEAKVRVRARMEALADAFTARVEGP